MFNALSCSSSLSHFAQRTPGFDKATELFPEKRVKRVSKGETRDGDG